jgi:orotate phosphoribosyltransferase
MGLLYCVENHLYTLVDLVAKTLVKTGGFLTWPDKTDEGVLQPFVLDLTTILNHPRVFLRVASGLLRIVGRKVGLESFEFLAGVPLAGVPYASYICTKTGKPMLLVRERARGKLVEGPLKMGDRVLVIDDSVATGRQILSTASKIVSEGGVVEQAVVIMCQSQSAVERLKNNGITLHELIDFKSLVRSLKRLDALTDEEYETLLSKA